MVDTTEITQNQPTQMENETVEIEKKTKGYTWRIRISAENIDEQADRLKKWDEWMWQNFGGSHENA